MDLPQAVDTIRPSIVQIIFKAVPLSKGVPRQSGQPYDHIPLGTGFFVNSDGYVITANHVIQYGRKIVETQGGQITVGLAIPNTENMRGIFVGIDFDVVDEDDCHDLALLKLRRNPFKGEVRSGIVIQGKELPMLYGAAALNPNRPRDGDAVGISGYPLSETVLVTNAGWMATSWSYQIAQHSVPIPGTAQWFRRPDVADSYLADVEVNPGNSGGPVYSVANSAIIGVCVASKPAPVRDQLGDPATINGNESLFYSSGLTIVVPVRYVIELLKKHKLSWLESTQ